MQNQLSSLQNMLRKESNGFTLTIELKNFKFKKWKKLQVTTFRRERNDWKTSPEAGSNKKSKPNCAYFQQKSNNTRTTKSEILTFWSGNHTISSPRQKKRQNELALEAKKALNARNNKTLHHITKQLCYRSHISKVPIPIKDKNGKPLLTVEKQPHSWAEHFSDVLHRRLRETPSSFEKI